MNHTANVAILKAINENEGKMDSIEHFQLKESNRKIIVLIDNARKNVAALPDFTSKTKIKEGTLNYFEEILIVEKEAVAYLIQIFDDNIISEDEIARIQSLQELISRTQNAGEKYINLQQDFYKEFQIPEEEIDKVFSKYHL